ncbi:hypothetical protein B0H14DRAFT_2562003 [Mycena olivaceomarginata]|nr:hypothetical protein B0H14DRAFT_2562003 [Mycena olivaceomarginata]
MLLSQSDVRDHNVHVSKREQGCLNQTRLNTIEPEALRTQPVPDGQETGIRNDGVPAPIKYDAFRRGEFWSEKELKVTLDGRPVTNDRHNRMEADAGQRRLLALWRNNTRLKLGERSVSKICFNAIKASINFTSTTPGMKRKPY